MFDTHILSHIWYQQSTMLLAREALGKILVTCVDGRLTAGRIVETEPYMGAYDKASHAYPMKLTPRTKQMFGPGGFAYVFRCHMYFQFCFVTEGENVPDAVLIRALEPLHGLDIMLDRRNKARDIDATSGPGKLCMAMGITQTLYGANLTQTNDGIWLYDDGVHYEDCEIVAAPRIGIAYAEEFAAKPWRFYLEKSPYISRRDKNAIPFSRKSLE